MSVPFLTPREVVDKMSFTPPRSKKKGERQPSYVPDGPPPADAPPTPPSTPPPPRSSADATNIPSYQHGDRNVLSDRNTELLRSLGDTTLRPNTGESNWAEGDGTALREVIWRMRLCNLMACTLAILFQIPAVLAQLIMLRPAKAVLSVYLVFFASILCCFEFHTPGIAQPLQDNFGMLYHPLSRSVYLVLLAGLCWGQGGVLMTILGFLWCGNALYTIFVYVHYPEYQRMAQNEQQKDVVGWLKRQPVVTKYYASWAHPDNSVGGFLQQEQQHDERERLMKT